jgi:hypothetical protein
VCAVSVPCAQSYRRRSLPLLQIIVFDVEFGQPAASSKLPPSRPAMRDIVGNFGHASAGKALTVGGIDVLYCLHVDDSISVWQRHKGLLTYSMVSGRACLLVGRQGCMNTLCARWLPSYDPANGV